MLQLMLYLGPSEGMRPAQQNRAHAEQSCGYYQCGQPRRVESCGNRYESLEYKEQNYPPTINGNIYYSSTTTRVRFCFDRREERERIDPDPVPPRVQTRIHVQQGKRCAQ